MSEQMEPSAELRNLSETMTVAQLIEKLKNAPQDALVWSEGCDCTEPAVDIAITHEDRVVICREDDE